MHGRLNRAVLTALASAILVIANAAFAQGVTRNGPSDYPAKPVRMIVPLAPGGGSDIVGRIVALGLSDYWGQPVVVDNRPGAGSTVGTSIAARAPADGYTLLVSSSSMAISPALYKNLNFDIRRDFDEVTLIASQPSILAVHPSVPASSVKELIALARSQPGRLSFASAGAGSATHLGTELLQHAAGISMLHVPYKSAGLATSALLSGEVQVLLTNMASTLPYVKSGKIKALGVSSRQAFAAGARTADDCRSRHCGFRIRDLVRNAGPGRHAQADYCPYPDRYCEDHQQCTSAGTVCQAGPDGIWNLSRGLPNLPGYGNREVGQAGARSGGAHPIACPRRGHGSNRSGAAFTRAAAAALRRCVRRAATRPPPGPSSARAACAHRNARRLQCNYPPSRRS